MTELTEPEEDTIHMQIIRAAQQLFQLHGLHKVTMDDVAREIGKRRSSLYYYYKSKEEILDAAIDVEMREIFTEIAGSVNKATNLEQKITAYYLTRLKISQKRRMFNNMIDSGINAEELADYKKIRNTMHHRFRQLEIPLLREVLDSGIEKGELRAMESTEQDALIFVMLSSMQGFKKEILLKKSFDSIEPAISMLTYLVTQGFKNKHATIPSGKEKSASLRSSKNT